MNSKIKDFFRKYTMVIALVIVFILFCVLTDGRLLYAQNMSNLMLQNGYVLVLACGMLLCILTGGNIDLSVGSVICFVGGVAAVLIGSKGFNPLLTIILCLVIGLLVGVWQGYWIGYKRIPPFITTLAGMFIFRGFGRLVLDNKTVSIQNQTFLNVFTSYINIPGLDDGKKYSALIVGVIIACYVIFSTMKSRANKAKKGYRQNTAASDYSRAAVIAVVILWVLLQTVPVQRYLRNACMGSCNLHDLQLHHIQDRIWTLLLRNRRQRESYTAFPVLIQTRFTLLHTQIWAYLPDLQVFSAQHV